MKDIIKKYREFVKRINPDIKVIKGFDWCCYNNTKEIEIPQLVTDNSLADFISTVEKQLAKTGNQALVKKYDDFIWCFLHEVGHLSKGKKYKDQVLRKFLDTLNIIGCKKIAKALYYRLKEEQTATEWACNYVINNQKLVAKYNWELIRRYKKYYKNIGMGV